MRSKNDHFRMFERAKMPRKPQSPSQKIGTLNEKALHAALKAWYTRPNDRSEVPVDGYTVDIVRDDLLIEIQTRNFAAIKRKMQSLATSHRLRLVYPLAREKWIVKVDNDQANPLSRRKSPKRGAVEQIFEELVSFPKLMASQRFSLHVLFIREEEVRKYSGRRGWRRRGWVTHERRLIEIVGQRFFVSPADFADLIPPSLDEPFTTADLAEAIAQPRRLAQKMAYCLRKMDAVAASGKRGNAILYSRALS